MPSRIRRVAHTSYDTSTLLLLLRARVTGPFECVESCSLGSVIAGCVAHVIHTRVLVVVIVVIIIFLFFFVVVVTVVTFAGGSGTFTVVDPGRT